ncbi:hypothetical protein HAX54_025157, partial [Datura stramonium]|nr:hypothetical protein [Datura stramonium]
FKPETDSRESIKNIYRPSVGGGRSLGYGVLRGKEWERGAAAFGGLVRGREKERKIEERA